MRWLLLVLLFPSVSYAGEDCSMLGGVCRELCSSSETIEKGAFLDCTDRQECCLRKDGNEAAESRNRSESGEVKQSVGKETGTK